jgi:hypothetical protein
MMIMDGDWVRISQEVVVICLQELSRHSVETEEKQENFSYDSL